jgi:DNA-binding CsgD family transcriptional regulator
MNFDSKELLLINEKLLTLYGATGKEQLLEAMFRVIRELVPCDTIGWNEFDMVSRAFKYLSSPPERVNAQQLEAVSRYAHQSPFPAYFAATGDRSWLMLTDFMPLEEYQKTDFYQHVHGPMGSNYQISSVIDHLQQTVFALTVDRTHQPFTERDRAVLNLIHPHLRLSYRNACAFDLAHRSIREFQAVVETGPGGFAYVQEDGVIRWATSRALAAWERFCPTDAKKQNGIPTSVEEWLRNIIHGKNRAQFEAVESIFERTAGDEKLEMRLLPSQFGGWVLAVDVLPLGKRSRFLPLHELTKRENEVLAWMTEGKRNAEIATILNISPRTVDRHVSAILQKLYVENRAAAIVAAMARGSLR